MSVRRASAIAALVLMGAAVILAAVLAVTGLPGTLLVVAGGVLAGVSAWQGIAHRGPERVAAFLLAAIAAAAAVVLIPGGRVPEWVGVAVLATLSAAATRAAFAARVHLAPAPAPRRPALLVNPRSGDGKAARAGLSAEAARRGIEVVELAPGDDPGEIARRVADEGADAIGMAGGDGSQAAVAAVAASRGLPFVCVPAGTRNHFALDLGVDRRDVTGALDAFADGGERVVDIATVNGRTFVNNVSLGIYADAVSSDGYRRAKLRTLLTTMAEWAREGPRLDLRWTGPGGHAHAAGGAILVSNNVYRLAHAVGSGTRPRMDEGRLGVVVAAGPTERATRLHRPQRPWREWGAAEFDVDADHPVPAGIDGEAVVLEPPLRFRIEPRALRVRIPPGHPGASPSARIPERPLLVPQALLRIVRGREA
jgi:diacylglycerol kinase family enzyme